MNDWQLWYLLVVLVITMMMVGHKGGGVLDMAVVYVLVFFGLPLVLGFAGLYFLLCLLSGTPPSRSSRTSDYGEAQQ